MTLPLEALPLQVWVRVRDQLQPRPLIGSLMPTPEQAEVLFELDEFDRAVVRLDAPEGVLVLEGYPRELYAGRTHELIDPREEEPDAYPWYPGTYELRLDAGGTTWWAKFRVRPRHLAGQEELEALRRELEDLVTGLSLDVAPGRGYMGAQTIHNNRLLLLQAAARELQTALRQIASEPYQALDRTYELMPFHRARRLDGKSFRWLAQGNGLRYGGAEGADRVVLAPRPHASYDTYENSVVAFILDSMEGLAQRLLTRLRLDLESGRRELAVARSRGWAAQVLAERLERFEAMVPIAAELVLTFRRLRRLPFLDSVRPLAEPPRPTVVLQKDPRYRLVFHWYRRLNGALAALAREDALHLRAKRTPVLYEYWCLLQIVELLRHDGYVLRNGWLADHLRRVNRDRLVPVIPPGSMFVLDAPGGREVRVHYDEALLQTVEQAEAAGAEFYLAGPHNRPDFRLDLYRKGAHVRSLVLDAKYSRSWWLWNPTRPTEVMWQLQNYVYNLFRVPVAGRRVVQAAVALYPGSALDPLWQERERGHVALARLAPGLDNQQFAAFLSRFAAGEGEWTP